MKNQLLLTIILCVVIGAGAFYAGMKYQQSQRSSFAGQFGVRRGTANGFGTGGNGGNRPVYGDIVSSDDTSITVKAQDGSSKIVLVTGTTSINKASAGTKADLTTGQTVAVYGITNSDGSLTAQNIQINPIMRGLSGTSGVSR